MKHILHISKFYPPYKGGIEDMAYSVVKSLKDNYKQTVICFNNNNSDKIDLIENIQIYRLGFFIKIFSQPISIKIIFKLKKILKKIKPDYIHFHAPNPLIGILLILLINKRSKLIIHWHGDIESRIRIYSLYRPLEKKILQRAQKIVITSPNYLSLSSVLLPFKEKVILIPNVINEKKLELRDGDIQVIKSIKNKYGEKIIFSFGRHVNYKGLEFLIKSEKFISNKCTILIAGSGPLTESLKSNSKSNRIHFIGRITDDELRQHLRASYLFAFPSITRGEAFGIALAEAMYCKLPSITFTIEGSGVNWVCPNNITGLEVENKNAVEYALAIDRLLSNSELHQKLANNAYNRVVNNFTIDIIKKKVIELYLNL